MTADYKVLKIDEGIRLGEAGGTERYYRHTILTKLGTRLTIDVNPDNFTPEKAAPILLLAAKNADAIKKG